MPSFGSAGVVVESAGPAPGHPLAAGDRLEHWSRDGDPPSRGAFSSPFELWRVAAEEGARGDVTVRGTRDGEPLEAVLASHQWDIEVRPGLDADGLSEWRAARELLAEGEIDRGVAALRRRAESSEDPLLSAWLLLDGLREGGRELSDALARDLADEAIRETRAAGDDGATARILSIRGDLLSSRGLLDEAEDAFRAALELRQESVPESLSVALSLDDLGGLALARSDLDAAEELFLRARELRVRQAPDSAVLNVSTTRLATVAAHRGDLDRAQEGFQSVVERTERLAPESESLADALTNLGNVAFFRADLDTAQALFERARDLFARLVPDSLAFARSSNAVGAVALRRGDLEAAEEGFGRALELRERLAPDSLDLARSLNNVALVELERGDLAGAQTLLARSLSVKEQIAPGSLSVATSLNNLGAVAVDRGDLATAEAAHLRALEIRERLAPDSVDLAVTLQNLGVVVQARGDSDRAETLLQRALEIKERRAPGSLEVAEAMERLAHLALDREDPETAERLYRTLSEIYERDAPESMSAAIALDNRGVAHYDLGELEDAEDLHRRALARKQKIAPDGMDVSHALYRLAKVGARRERLDEAEELYRRALSIRGELAPDSRAEAEVAHELGVLLRDQGRLEEAVDLLSRAVAALDGQLTRLGGGDDARAGYRARFAAYYRDYVDLLVRLGRHEDAFSALERSRARQMVALLAQRDLVWDVDIPAELDLERRRLRVELDRVVAELAETTGSPDGAERREIRERLEDVRDRRRRVQDRIRAASPRLAALTAPEHLDASGTVAALDSGTLLLSWSIGDSRTHLFALGPGDRGLTVTTSEVGADRLRREVEWFRRLVTGGAGRTASAAVLEVSRDLTATLLEPVADRVAASERIVVVPDGPLFGLPFAALRNPLGEGWLVEARPVTTVASATVLDQLSRERRDDRPGRLVGFGDPRYSTGDAAVSRAGTLLKPLPATRDEVESLASIFPETSEIWLGAEATEERVKSVGEGVTLLHLAAHGILDEWRPLDSAIALAVPGPSSDRGDESTENGLLQAWEIFEEIRLDADLVTLSACETALGGEFAGEGILGLSRSFLYAGARSVLASLWRVEDDSTAALMQRFYLHLGAGATKDEALRQAQLELIRGPIRLGPRGGGRELDASGPVFWAAFGLIGDWR